ncbi:sulfatase [Bacteroidota bacterium]
MKSRSIIFFFLAGLMVFGCTEKQEYRPPNVILFFSDELDPGYVSAYDGPIPTPNIDKLASEGIRFDRAFVTAPMCTPSRFSLLTGLYPGRCDHPQFLDAYPREDPYTIAWNTYLTETIVTIPKVLSKHGYFTGMVGKWHIGRLPDDIEIPVFRDDDDLDDPVIDEKLKSLQNIHIDRVRQEGGFDYAKSVLWGNFDGFALKELRFHNFPWITKGALDFLDAASIKDQPFFLYSATTAVHGPGHVNAFQRDINYTLEGKMRDLDSYNLNPDSMMQVLSGIEGRMRHKYAGMACVDHHVKLVIQKLESLGLDDNTMVIFMADHNIEPGKTTCYEKGLKVPLIVRWPDRIQPNTISQVMVQSLDLFPTILKLAGIGSQDLKLDGKSIDRVLTGDGTAVHNYIYSESGLIRSVSDGKYKYISFRYPKSRTEQIEKGEIEYAPNYMNMERQAHSSIAMAKYPSYFDADQLFDLENDPYEQHNLAYDPEHQEILNKMQEVLLKYLSGFNHAYHFGDTAIMRSEKYSELAAKSRAIGTSYIPWLQRDHGSIIWPPE